MPNYQFGIGFNQDECRQLRITPTTKAEFRVGADNTCPRQHRKSFIVRKKKKNLFGPLCKKSWPNRACKCRLACENPTRTTRRRHAAPPFHTTTRFANQIKTLTTKATPHQGSSTHATPHYTTYFDACPCSCCVGWKFSRTQMCARETKFTIFPFVDQSSTAGNYFAFLLSDVPSLA